MVDLSKNILRGTLIVSYLVLLGFILFGISALLSYLNTGADRSTMLNTEIQKSDQYLPKITWSAIQNEGRKIDAQTLENIENDYLNAWYVRHVALNTNRTDGIEEYFTESARENIFDVIMHNKADNIHIESTTLEHHPSLEFFSEDGQFVVLSDNNVVEYKAVYNDDKLILETTETASYKIILLLEDKFWRIRHLVKISSKKGTKVPIVGLISEYNINGINYYPKDTPWTMFGDSFNIDVISNDFKIIKESGLNTIRLFLQYDDFGKATVNPEKIEKLRQVLDTADLYNLKAIITLFDFYGNYSVLDWTLNHRHAEMIVSTFKEHNAILGWDIKNEPDLDFESRGKDRVLAWLDKMIDLVKLTDPNHPVTIGWSNTENATFLHEKVDFISFHYYKDLDSLEESYTNLKALIQDKSIVLGEFGISSYSGFWKPFGGSDKKQADYHKAIQNIIQKNDIHYLSWTLYDFNEIPREVVGRIPWRKNVQKHFGFLDNKGIKKKSFNYISKQ